MGGSRGAFVKLTLSMPCFNVLHALLPKPHVLEELRLAVSFLDTEPAPSKQMQLLAPARLVQLGLFLYALLLAGNLAWTIQRWQRGSLTILHSHSRAHEVPHSKRERMLKRPTDTFARPTGRRLRDAEGQTQFFSCSTYHRELSGVTAKPQIHSLEI